MGIVLLFYKYVAVRYPKQLQKWQRRLCSSLGLTGRIIIASEGINGTVGGTEEAIAQYSAALRAHELLHDIDLKHSAGSAADFSRLYVTIKDEIVALGISPALLPAAKAGRHITPAQAHALLAEKAEDLVVLDGRNDYESAVGSFEGALKPNIEHFRELPRYLDDNLEQFRNKRVVMYCTGGVRCERASAYLQEKGVAKEVLQIAGGIHRYVEQYPQGFFRGKNYVFDQRVTVPVTDDILATCKQCDTPCDQYEACAEVSCKRQLIVCDTCAIYANRCKEHAITCSVSYPQTEKALERE